MMLSMDAHEPTKVCPLCAETIKASAKVCPFCRSRQGRFTILKGELASAFTVIALLGVLAAMGLWMFPEPSDPESDPYFVRHRDELPVVRTTLESTKKVGHFWLSGFVTNRGHRPWRVHGLEVRFLDAQGGLLEAQHEKAEAFVVQPGTEHAFRIELYNVLPSVTGAVQLVRVESASDGQQYDPD